jgi:hypothetical protein
MVRKLTALIVATVIALSAAFGFISALPARQVQAASVSVPAYPGQMWGIASGTAISSPTTYVYRNWTNYSTADFYVVITTSAVNTTTVYLYDSADASTWFTRTTLYTANVSGTNMGYTRVVASGAYFKVGVSPESTASTVKPVIKVVVK